MLLGQVQQVEYSIFYDGCTIRSGPETAAFQREQRRTATVTSYLQSFHAFKVSMDDDVRLGSAGAITSHR